MWGYLENERKDYFFFQDNLARIQEFIRLYKTASIWLNKELETLKLYSIVFFCSMNIYHMASAYEDFRDTVTSKIKTLILWNFLIG